MKATLSSLVPGQAILLGVVVIGCATAGLVTGHLSSGDWMTAVGIVVGGGAAVTGAHVGGLVANTATATTTQSTAGPSAPSAQSAPAVDPVNPLQTASAP